MKKSLVVTALAALCTAAAFAADAPVHVSLLVAEAQPGKNVADPQLLVRYRLEEGKLKKREVLSTTANAGPRYDLGGNRVYKNRYVITHWGDVFDLETNKFLHEGSGEELIACEGDQVVSFRSNDGGFYSYDLAAGQFAKMDDPGKWKLLLKGLALSHSAELSPDGTKSIVDAADSSPAPANGKKTTSVFGTGGTLQIGAGKLTLCAPGEKPRILGEGFLSKVSPKSSDIAQSPVLWLDNDRVLSQRGNGKLAVLKLDGSVEAVVDIGIQNLPLSLPTLSRDPAGRIIYTCVDSYVIDVEKKSFAKLEWQNVGDSFEIEVVKAPATSRIRYMGKEIGFDSLDTASAKTMAGNIAVAPVKMNSESQRTLRVWSSAGKSWMNLELGGHLVDIIGWVEDHDSASPAAN